jgi:hypothetical protein
MVSSIQQADAGQAYVSRRTVIKGGVSVAIAAAAALVSARSGGAAVTSMDQRSMTVPINVPEARKPGKVTDGR